MSKKNYTCNECEDEVNPKGHLTKLQKAVHVDNVKYIKSEQNVVKSDFNVSMYCDFIRKWSKYYTCKGIEVQVNQKGHLTKHQFSSMYEPKEGPLP